MLDWTGMRTMVIASLVASAFSLAASADPVPRGPDFLGARPAHGVDRSLAASDGRTPIDPLDDVAFQFGQAVLLPAATAQIDRAANWMKTHPRERLVIEGHTDRVGTTQYNEDLATRRAEAVREYLIKKGLPSDRMVLVIYGEASPDDRRAVIYASDRPVDQIVASSIDHGHAELAVWTNKGTLLREQRTPTAGRQVIATRR